MFKKTLNNRNKINLFKKNNNRIVQPEKNMYMNKDNHDMLNKSTYIYYKFKLVLRIVTCSLLVNTYNIENNQMLLDKIPQIFKIKNENKNY